MKKKAKRFWRYFGPSLVLLEVCNFAVLRDHYMLWQYVCLGFLLLNFAIITYLVNIKRKVQLHNAQVDAARKAEARLSTPVTASESIAIGNAMPIPALA